MIFTSLIICVARDPGPVALPESGLDEDGEQVGLTEALSADFDFSAPGKWCRKCWVRVALVATIGLRLTEIAGS